MEGREQGGIGHNTTFKREAVQSLALVLGKKSGLELRDLIPQVGKLITRKDVTPDLTSEMSTDTERYICIQAQSGLNDESTVSMMKIKLWRG